jgi:hypothetical protein
MRVTLHVSQRRRSKPAATSWTRLPRRQSHEPGSVRRCERLKKFTAELYEGHSDCAVIVPFDPAQVWKTKPHRIGYRSYVGHAVRGTVGGEQFESWIWFYFHQWRMVIPDRVLEAVHAAPGDTVKITVRPHPSPEAVAAYTPGPKRR